MNGRSAELGLTINEFYGQTECNLVLSDPAARSASAGQARSDAPVPGPRGRDHRRGRAGG